MAAAVVNPIKTSRDFCLHHAHGWPRSTLIGRPVCRHTVAACGLGFSCMRWQLIEDWSSERNKSKHFRRRVAVKAALAESDRKAQKTPNAAILMEIEGVIADVHHHGHRQAFNMTFRELGLDCANWTDGVYADLMRVAGGDEEKMLRNFFHRIGWPMMVPTNERDALVRKVVQLKSAALEKLVQTDQIPFRPGLVAFVDEALEAGVSLVILAANYRGGERLARLFTEKLGSDRSRRIRFVGESDVRNSAYGQVALGEGASAGLDERLAAEVSRAVAAEKLRMAHEVASFLNLSVEIDTTSPQMSKKTIATLRAGAEIGEKEVKHCILLASGYSASQAANQIGMPCVIVRSSVTARAEFPDMNPTLDGYGPGSTTLSRLLKLL